MSAIEVKEKEKEKKQEKEKKEEKEEKEHRILLPTSLFRSTMMPSITIGTLAKQLGSIIEHSFCLGLPTVYKEADAKINPATWTFLCTQIPLITVSDYLHRIAIYSNISAETLVLSVIQLARISLLPDVPLTSTTIHRLILTSVLVCTKYCDDVFLKNRFYAELGGISVSELNDMEVEFLFLVQFDFDLSEEQYTTILIAVIQNDQNLFVTISNVLKTKHKGLLEL